MLRSSNSLQEQHETSPNVYNYKTWNEMVTRPTSERTSHQSKKNKQTFQKLLADRPVQPSMSQILNKQISLDEVTIEGRWNYRKHDDDYVKFKTLNIGNLVYICHDIMKKTQEIIKSKEQLSVSCCEPLTLVKVDVYKTLTDAERAHLNRAHILDLMTIVFEATTTNASLSQLIRIWREAYQHVNRHTCSSTSEHPPKISYELAFRHLIHTPDNQILQIALHASLISGYSRMDLQELGEKLGVKSSHFDMGSIRDSRDHFQDLIKLLREQKLKREREQQSVNIHKLPYKPRKKRGLTANVSGTKFAVVRQAADVYGFSISSDIDFTSNFIWNDTLISMDIVSALKPYQKVNHFPTMSEISRKDLLAKNFDKLSRVLPDEYNFTPRTWILPNEYNAWYSYASNKPKKESCAYILKPNNGAMGHGIQVFCDYERIQPMDNYIIQEYIPQPYLIDGYKFDLRIYALVTSCDPLRLFIFNNGLVRMSTEKYETPNRKNASHLFMHLTNYSVNKYNVDYEIGATNSDGEKTGSKRSLKYLFEYLRSHHQDATTLWKEIQNIVIKTVFLAEPHLFAAYRMCRPGASPSSESVCFEILGFDILVDQNLKPWVLEVNRCPSFGTNEQIDFDIKMKLLLDSFELLRFRTSDRKKSLAIEKAEAQRRLYSNMSKTTRLLDDTSSILSNGNYKDFRTTQKKLVDVKEKLYLLQRETARETFENRHLGSFIRLFPVEDSIRMNELMTILTKCFDVLYANKKDLSWNNKYYSRFKEEELLEQLDQLEDLQQNEQKLNPRLAFSAPSSKSSLSSWSTVSFANTSNMSILPDRASPTASFASESTDNDDDDDEDQEYQPQRSVSPHHSDVISRNSSVNNISTTNYLMKRYAAQSRSSLFRTTPSISPLTIPKQKTNSKTLVQRPISQVNPANLKSNFFIEKKDSDRSNQQSRSTTRSFNNKKQTQFVSYTTITPNSTKPSTSNTPSTARSNSFLLIKENQLNEDEFNRLCQLTLEQMHQLCIRYPEKSDEETRRIYMEINENWGKYRNSIGEFWLTRLDSRKRQSIIKIVWNNVQKIIKKIWTMETFIEQLSLNKHFVKLEQKLLANNGQFLWDLCQKKQNSFESTMIVSKNRLSPFEVACCNRFIELCKHALFIVYRYSIDENAKKQRQTQQKQQQGENSTIVVFS